MKKEEVENYLHQKIEKGETVSPILPGGIKNYLIDIDGTICDDVPNEEPERMVTAEKWLKDNGFKYHSLLMGKPRGGNYHWIDNHLVKATRYNGKFTDLIEKTVTIEVFDDEESKK